MEIDTKVIGKMDALTVRAHLIMRMEKYLKVIGYLVNQVDKGY